MCSLVPLPLTIILDSGLESIHRKELKGWTRSDGIVKEKSSSSIAPLINTRANCDAGVIHSIHYHRLILDEAHSIKVGGPPSDLRCPVHTG